MLIITRRQKETVLVHSELGQIVFTVLGQEGKYYRVGVDAPQNWSVSRGECVKTSPRAPTVIAKPPEVSPDGKTLTWKTGRTTMLVRIEDDGTATTEVLIE